MRLALLLLLLLPQDAEWPSYHGDYSLTGVADTTVPDAPVELWKFKAGKYVEFTPIVGDGRVYFTTMRGRIFALDMKGEQVWRKDIKPNDFTAPPLYAEKLVIVGTQKGFLHAYDAATGNEAWKYEVEDGIIGSANRVDLKDGTKAVTVIAQATGAIHCVDLKTGKGLWKTEEIDRSDGSASVGGGRIVMGSCASALHVFSIEERKKTADIPLGEECQVAGGVALSGKQAFAGTRSGIVCAVDVTTGKVDWTNKDNKSEAFTTPAVNKDWVIFGADDGFIYGLNRKDGKQIWKFDTDNLPTSAVIAGERVVVAGGGTIYILNLKDGKKVWSAKVSDELTSPAVVNGMIIVGADDGTVTAYGTK